MVTEIKNLKIYFEAHGTGEPLLLLHGWGVDSQIWQPIIPHLDGTFKVIAVDLPGFGQSDPPPKPWGVFDYADFVKDFIDDLELKSVTLLGHSFGGRIAIATASLDPKGLKKLILISSAGIKPKRGLKYYSFFTLAKVLGTVLKLPTIKGFQPYFRQKLYQLLGEHDYETAGPLKETFLKVINQDLTSILRSIEVPTLIVWGEDDREVPLSDAQKMQLLIKNSKLEIIKNAGHFCFLEKSEGFCQIVKNFIHEQT